MVVVGLVALLALAVTNALNLFSMSPEAAAVKLGGSGRAKKVWDLVRAGEDPFGADGEAKLPAKTVRALRASFSESKSTVISETASACGTRKLLIALESGGDVETVVIPHVSHAFSTLCVSSQVGCRQACSFCATGAMGLHRSLESREIVLQVHCKCSLE